MCTAATYKTKDFYFGRTLDYDFSYGEEITVTPRNYIFSFKHMEKLEKHYAMIGMAHVEEDYPLYYEAVNEKGLCMAGLNFPDNAYYPPEERADCSNISPFEVILWLLGKCATAAEAKELLSTTHLIHIPFSEEIPLSPLHWHIADKEASLVLEMTKNGMEVYDNPIGVLTNNPTFPFQMTNTCQYMNLTAGSPSNCFSTDVHLKPFGLGLGSFGLPGDFSPYSRFVKASYLRLNSVCEADEPESVAQFFHLLDSVSMVRGSVLTEENKYDLTLYSCCINASRGIYYYKTYSNNQLTAVNLNHENLNGCSLRKFPLRRKQQVAWMN